MLDSSSSMIKSLSHSECIERSCDQKTTGDPRNHTKKKRNRALRRSLRNNLEERFGKPEAFRKGGRGSRETRKEGRGSRETCKARCFFRKRAQAVYIIREQESPRFATNKSPLVASKNRRWLQLTNRQELQPTNRPGLQLTNRRWWQAKNYRSFAIESLCN
jgi:hypothetical protein